MRGKGKSTIVWLLMGMLIVGLGGFGVTNFSGGTADIGAVGERRGGKSWPTQQGNGCQER